MKTCTKCKQTKSESLFYPDRRNNRLHPWCKECVKTCQRARNKAHPEIGRESHRRWTQAHPDYNKLAARKKRAIVLEAYGGACQCPGGCDVVEPKFLSIDHINGGGTKLRKTQGAGSGLYLYIIRNNFPSDFRLLCHNCNQARSCYGLCPHEERKII